MEPTAPSIRDASAAATTMTSPAVTASFDIAEILEEILTYLSTKELLSAQAVSKQWKEAILASTKLQRTLFLAPENPIKTSRRPYATFHGGWNIVPNGETLEGAKMKKDVNAVILSKSDPPVDGTHDDQNGLYAAFGVSYPDAYPRYPHGSWKDMFLSQPPCTRVGVCVGVPVLTRPGYEYVWPVENPYGVRFGEIIARVCEELHGSDEPCKSCLRQHWANMTVVLGEGVDTPY
ncbi:uncharacterized protein LTR77_005844 [Saxophila tyrrhenica]|uniref:F-box domain-containing protein n=1 Tax=Saxophila tyrrhenica TaxID=1690608 RepID=A0AAV9PBW0_9PEZI|nr:hypothetical protein LTR77_005844 [Saxophila tyrrhenica]